MYFTMIIFNSSKDFYASDGKVLIKPFTVEAGQVAYLTLTAPESAKGRIEMPIERVVDGIENCPEYEGRRIMSAHKLRGKPVALGYHDDAAKHVSDKIMIDWPGRYVIGTDMVQSMNNPCQPIAVELHIAQKHAAQT